MYEWKLDVKKQKSIVDVVAENLRNAIISGQLEPGRKLTEQEISDNMNVSRTPVREAFRLLEVEGYLTHKPRCGVIVSELSIRDIEEIWAVRAHLDQLVAEYTARNVDDRLRAEIAKRVGRLEEVAENLTEQSFTEVDEGFHAFFVGNCGNRRLEEVTKNLRLGVSLIRKKPGFDAARARESLRECMDIYRALAANDVEAAKAATKTHFDKALEFIKSRIQ